MATVPVNPKPFQNDLTGKLILVKLKWSMEYKGTFKSLDPYMNLQMLDAGEDDLTGKLILVKLKKGMEYKGTLKSIDPYMSLEMLDPYMSLEMLNTQEWGARRPSTSKYVSGVWVCRQLPGRSHGAVRRPWLRRTRRFRLCFPGLVVVGDNQREGAWDIVRTMRIGGVLPLVYYSICS